MRLRWPDLKSWRNPRALACTRGNRTAFRITTGQSADHPDETLIVHPFSLAGPRHIWRLGAPISGLSPKAPRKTPPGLRHVNGTGPLGTAKGMTPLEPSWLWPLLIEECLLGEEGQERAQSGAVELGGLELDSGAEQSCAAEESNSLPLAFSCLSLAFSSLSCSVSSLSSFILCS